MAGGVCGSSFGGRAIFMHAALCEVARTDRRLVENLDDDAVGIANVKRNRSVTMMLQRMHDIEATRLRPRPSSFDLGDTRRDESEMIEHLPVDGGTLAFMKREIIASGRQISVLRIGLPDELHSKNARIEFLRALDIGNLKREMAKSAMINQCSIPMRMAKLGSTIYHGASPCGDNPEKEIRNPERVSGFPLRGSGKMRASRC